LSLRDELESVRLPGPPCTVSVWFAKQDDPMWAELFADPGVQSAQLYRLARTHGYVGSQVTFSRHRKGGCACGQPAR
jgi:hypothetical protein